MKTIKKTKKKTKKILIIIALIILLVSIILVGYKLIMNYISKEKEDITPVVKEEIKYDSKNLNIFCIGDKNTYKIFENEYYIEVFGKNKVEKEELINFPEKYIIKDSYAISQFLNYHHDFKKANLIYSYWSGYMSSDRFHWKKYREQILQVHTSGHIDKDNLINFVKRINPKKIIPIHTISTKCFKEMFEDKVVTF